MSRQRFNSYPSNNNTFPGGVITLQDLVYWGSDRKARYKVIQIFLGKDNKVYVQVRSKRLRHRRFWIAPVDVLTFIRRACKSNHFKQPIEQKYPDAT